MIMPLTPEDHEAIERALDRLFAEPPPPLSDRQKRIIELAFKGRRTVSHKGKPPP